MKKNTKIIDLFNNKKIVENTSDVKYSAMLEKLMAAFQHDFPKDFYFEDIVEFSLNAWNLANMSAAVPEKEFKKIINQDSIGEFDASLLKKMIDYKINHFKKYTNYIADYELSELNGKDVLTVITQLPEDYLTEMFEHFDNQAAENNLQENAINRNAIIVKPLQPFTDWKQKLYPEEEFEPFNESNIYLVDMGIENLEQWLRKKYDKIFILELEEWCPNKKDWPQKRNYKMFKQWFQVDVSTLVYDLEKQPVLKY